MYKYDNARLIVTINPNSLPIERAYNPGELANVIFHGNADERQLAKAEWRNRFSREHISCPGDLKSGHPRWAQTAHQDAWLNDAS